MFDTNLTFQDLLFLGQGALLTLSITLIAVAVGTLLGVVFGVIRYQIGPIWAAPMMFLLDVLRSVPLLIQLILVNSAQAIFKFGWSPFLTSCIVLSLYTSAYCAEIVRGGIEAVPPATRRAARSLGLSWRQDMTNIVFPMALRVALPSWIGLALGVMKDSALVMWIGVIEVMKSSQILITRLQEPLFILLIAGAIYFCLSFPIARLGGRLEKRWNES